MSESLECLICGTRISSDVVCPYCNNRSVAVQIQGAEAAVEPGRIGAAAEQIDAYKKHIVQQLCDPLDRGEDNELRVMNILAKHIQTRIGSEVMVTSARNERGEDGAFCFADGGRQLVQVTMAVKDPAIWHELGRNGWVEARISFEVLVREIRAAIETKAQRLEPKARSTLWLLLDACLTPMAARPEIATAYFAAHGCPSAEFGFPAVWIVVPVPDVCIDLCSFAFTDSSSPIAPELPAVDAG